MEGWWVSVELKDGKEMAEISRKGCAIPFVQHCSNSGKNWEQSIAAGSV